VIYVDTSAFYAYLSRDDQDHESVAEAFRVVLDTERDLVACSYVLAETMGLVQHRLGLGVLTRFVEDMLPLVQVRWVGPEEHAAAWHLVRQVKKKAFTMVDAASATFMQRDGARRILALDPEFGRLGFTTLPPPGGKAAAGPRHPSKR
jgi:predicted nucleic acid-binding protein